jgi:hypothetical protein
MANIPIYDGAPSFTSGSSTPFGFYDNDSTFQSDALKVTNFCARRLGWPIVDVELQDDNFFAAFEQATTVYGNELSSYKVRQDYLSLEGLTTSSNLDESFVNPNLGNIIKQSLQYGTEAGSGGDVDWKTGSLNLTSSIQVYDLNSWALDQGFQDKDLEIRRIFYEEVPAVVKSIDPYSGTGMMNVIQQFGSNNAVVASRFTLMPLNYDLQLIQQIEMNSTIKRSNFSFEIQNNKLRIFPIPDGSIDKLYFQFLLKSERLSNSLITNPGIITNVSNVPYNNPTYSKINSIGRSWIFEYTLALCKEMLGYIRGKYSNIPIPNSEMTLNQSDLLSSAASDKASLIENLREFFNETSREKLLERRSTESENRNKEISNVPMPIYIF